MVRCVIGLGGPLSSQFPLVTKLMFGGPGGPWAKLRMRTCERSDQDQKHQLARKAACSKAPFGMLEDLYTRKCCRRSLPTQQSHALATPSATPTPHMVRNSRYPFPENHLDPEHHWANLHT